MKILVSPGYGAGWSTWNYDPVSRLMLTYQPIIEAIERGERMSGVHPAVKQLEKDCLEKLGKEYVCVLGADDLVVEEACPPFKVVEYDGYESVESPTGGGWVLS